MQQCECVLDGAAYLCLCPCGVRIRSSRPKVFHVCDPPVMPLAIAGPGTEMKALLAKIGIVASPTCSCNKRAKIMDEKGCDWCAENIDEIDRWLAEEAKKRKLPYLSLAGKALIHLAIRRARKKGNSR